MDRSSKRTESIPFEGSAIMEGEFVHCAQISISIAFISNISLIDQLGLVLRQICYLIL